ncbi:MULTISPECIES: hypothetical protein [unclassified Rhodococcus (in: high G+C Gram-positive bacteria)]|uniref:hypothetical protein n=1 Tax=unclassified Rhodococcus (in: high G+C Gram-positive bacteria) TaxID=192944 RepID=UPI0007BC4566|nr:MULTISPECIES: hypothetical protein [unclassified Rhodococcus (in: high G+C Gram-positive bacteria)]KZF03357.1 hypothetical protein A2J04_07245 [Rhodococcus sp. EPR-279]KZF06113.1 hypothetical protein A2J02_22495 [Rhodococcus sp. EPR-147]
MSEKPNDDRSAEDDASRARAERARLARIFGEVLPETTGDERSDGAGTESGGRSSDEWLKQQRPPHYF